MQKDYFEYPTPYISELRQMYKTPYRFSQELRDFVDYMFSHPYNKHNSLYISNHWKWDANDMIKPAYLMAKYFLDYPQQFNDRLDSIFPSMLVAMWRQFVGIHKHKRNLTFDEYKQAIMKMMKVGEGKFLDLLIEEIKQDKMIMSNDDMVKVREGVGLRERKLGYSESQLAYYDTLD